jgi:hypothetical protein
VSPVEPSGVMRQVLSQQAVSQERSRDGTWSAQSRTQSASRPAGPHSTTLMVQRAGFTRSRGRAPRLDLPIYQQAFDIMRHPPACSGATSPSCGWTRPRRGS